MIVKSKFLFCLFVLTFLSGCGFVYEKKIDDLYAIIAVDTINDASVCRFESGSYVGRINHNVEAVGCLEGFIFARKSDDTYWLLNRSLDRDFASEEDCVEGPFCLMEFKGKVRDLGFNSEIKFKWYVR